MPGTVRAAVLQLRTAQRLVRRDGPRLGAPDDRMVFVVGSPRSGTSFLGHSIGSLPGFVDLGEVAPLKASIPELSGLLPPEAAADRIRRTLIVARRLGLVGPRRAVEQTPESAFVAGAIRLAFPAAKIVHIVRDGRDVVCSLLDRGWLSAERRGEGDDVGLPFGAEPRFWVEPARADEFRHVSDARRAAWAWRRYVTAARSAEPFELRYEEMAREPHGVARGLAEFLGAPRAELERALGGAHEESIRRHTSDLTAAQRADVLEESGELLRELGYVD